MLCKIADIITEVPPAGGMASRCADYLYDGKESADIIIRADLYRPGQFDPARGEESFAYMESGYQFYLALVEHGGFYLHSSAVVLDGKAYLFSGPSRAGKSTHARLWQRLYGSAVTVINDDKPALRRVDGVWYAYGTPWCGKDGINQNAKAPLAGVCFLKQARENKIRRLDTFEAMQRILSQTIYRLPTVRRLDLFLGSLEQFLHQIPVYELENAPNPDAAILSSQTMRQGAREANL